MKSRRIFRVEEGSLQYRFLQSRAKVQIYGGGFANGKTAASCIKALQLARDYPGSNGLIARATYPKLNDTIRKEFLKWCPAHWIKSFPMSQNASNTCTLKNGTEINFRYIAQQGKASSEATTSNLLSANYDWIVVDQMEDPEITEKDFDDLHGRLRGMTPYVGDDDEMPRTGPRWFIITTNPTRNWVYRKLVKPVHIYEKTRVVTPELLFDEVNKKPIIELYEGSTYENKSNLPEDFIRTLEITYRGQMRERFLHGRWGAYEGLVYPAYDEDVHKVSHKSVIAYLNRLRRDGFKPEWLEGYDHGYAVPSCYLLGFVDPIGNVIIADGFYAAEQTIEKSTDEIKRIRREITGDGSYFDNVILADPILFARGGGDRKTVGITVAELFYNNGFGVTMARGNNNIINGITKVRGYIELIEYHRNPFTSMYGAPYLYFSDRLQFVADEFGDYCWKRNTEGATVEQPVDKNDHAMDTIKYMLSHRPNVAKMINRPTELPSEIFRWNELDRAEASPKWYRYAS